MLKRRGLSVLGMFLLIFFVSGAGATLDLTITSYTVGMDDQSDLVVTTSSNSNEGLDGFDLQSNSQGLPDNVPLLTSSVVGTSLSIDSWGGEERDLNLVYGPITAATTLGLDSGAYDSRYELALNDCGNDSTYQSCDDGFILNRFGESNAVSLVGSEVGGYRYLKLTVSLASLITGDTGGSGGSGGSGFGMMGGGTLAELVAPIMETLSVNESAGTGEQIVFKYAGVRHTVGVTAIRAGEADIAIQSSPQYSTLLLGERKKYDLDGDGIADVSVKLLFVDLNSSTAKLEISPLRILSSISVNPGQLTLNMILGKELFKEITLTNPTENNLSLDVVFEGLDDAVSTENTITLKSKETKTLNLKFKVHNMGVLNGKILFKQGNQVFGELPVILNIRSENFLFDSSINVENMFNSVKPGESLRTHIILTEVGNAGNKVDVVATYVIKDYYGNIYLEDSETFAVTGKRDYIKEFDTTKLPEGKYVIGLEIVYPGAFATSSVDFTVSSSFWTGSSLLLVITSGFMLLVIFILLLWVRNRNKITFGPNGHKI